MDGVFVKCQGKIVFKLNELLMFLAEVRKGSAGRWRCYGAREGDVAVDCIHLGKHLLFSSCRRACFRFPVESVGVELGL
uniref:Uncharacterized protein n=1 Tax=Aegilops tauschii subsp. strangulata TaxID=200361 RepID=A0A453KEP9_AEGTS